MKTPLQCILLFLLAMSRIASAAEPADRIIVVPIEKAPQEVPLFFSAAAEVKARVGLETITSEQRIDYRIHQGKPETLTLALGGAGEVVSVAGEGLRDWALRVADDGSRFLDVRPVVTEGELVTSLSLLVRTHLELKNGTASLLLPGAGPANGFSLAVTLTVDPGTDLRVVKADRLVPLEAAEGRRFLGHGGEMATLELNVSAGGTGARGLELMDSSLTGNLAADGNSVEFRLTGFARSEREGSAVELLGGGAALSGAVAGDGWHVVLRGNDGGYDLVAERGGDFPVAVDFVAPVSRKCPAAARRSWCGRCWRKPDGNGSRGMPR